MTRSYKTNQVVSTLLLFSLPCCCCCSVTKLCLFMTPRTAACQVLLPFTISQSLLKFMSTESVMLSNHPILCWPLLLLLQFLLASGSFQMSWLFASGGPSIKLSHPFHHSGHREKISIYKLGSRPGLLDTESSGTEILEILVSRTERNNCLFLKSSIYNILLWQHEQTETTSQRMGQKICKLRIW